MKFSTFSLIVILSSFGTIRVMSQNNASSSMPGQTIESLDYIYSTFRHQKEINGITEDQYEGTPYLTNKSNNNELIYNNNRITGLRLRYNVYNDEMEFEKDGVFYLIPKNTLFSDFIIDGHHFKLLSNFKDENKKNCYLEVLSETDNVYLYKKHQVAFYNAEKPGAIDAKPARFKPSFPIYFISINNSELTSFTTQKELLKLFQPINSELKTYIKKNKLKFKDEQDLIKMLAYIETKNY